MDFEYAIFTSLHSRVSSEGILWINPSRYLMRVKHAAPLVRRSRLADLNRRAREVMAQVQREYGVQYGIRLIRLH